MASVRIVLTHSSSSAVVALSVAVTE